MEHQSDVSAPANHSQYGNSSLVSDGTAGTSEYSDAELVLLAVAMGVLALAIVFGKSRRV